MKYERLFGKFYTKLGPTFSGKRAINKNNEKSNNSQELLEMGQYIPVVQKVWYPVVDCPESVVESYSLDLV